MTNFVMNIDIRTCALSALVDRVASLFPKYHEDKDKVEICTGQSKLIGVCLGRQTAIRSRTSVA